MRTLCYRDAHFVSSRCALHSIAMRILFCRDAHVFFKPCDHRLFNLLKVLQILVLCGLWSGGLWAQDLEVVRFERTQNSDARLYPQRDRNGQFCALVKIASPLQDLKFDASLGVTKVEYKKGEHWVYLTPGEKRLSIWKTGYTKIRYIIEKRIEKSTTYHLTLKENVRLVQRQETIAPGALVIESTPSGATVYIDGKSTSLTTPFSKVMDNGTYDVALKLEHYRDHRFQVKIKSESTEQRTVNLKANFAALTVRGLAGSRIYLDGERTPYQTPHTFPQVSPGTHTITLKRELYQDQTKQVRVVAGAPQTVRVDLQARFGTLKVETLAGAKVYLDKKYIGTGSLSREVLEGLAYVEVKKEGYYPLAKRVQMRRDETQTIDATLRPMKGVLTVNSTPYGAEVLIGGVSIGKTPLSKSWNVGTYAVVLEREDYDTHTVSATIREGETTEIEHTLEDLQTVAARQNAALQARWVEGYGTPSRAQAVWTALLVPLPYGNRMFYDGATDITTGAGWLFAGQGLGWGLVSGLGWGLALGGEEGGVGAVIAGGVGGGVGVLAGAALAAEAATATVGRGLVAGGLVAGGLAIGIVVGANAGKKVTVEKKVTRTRYKYRYDRHGNYRGYDTYTETVEVEEVDAADLSAARTAMVWSLVAAYLLNVLDASSFEIEQEYTPGYYRNASLDLNPIYDPLEEGVGLGLSLRF